MENKGTVVLELPPSQGNPRNSEGAFIDCKDGKLLFIYSKFIGDSWADWGCSVLAKRWSDDGGTTWSEDEIVVTHEEHGVDNIMSVSLLRMNNEDIGMFYMIRKGWHDTRLFLRRSADEGRTWGEAVCCMPAPGYYNVNNDRVIRLSTGRLIIPACYFRMRGESTVDPDSFDCRAFLVFYISDDDGYNWREARSVYTLQIPRLISGLDEPGIVELSGGTLWAWCRTEAGCQYETFSHDGGNNWSVPVPSIFTSPSSPLSMKRLPQTGHLLAVWNPVPQYQTRPFVYTTWGRSPLTLATSTDEGESWARFVELENDEASGYCYTAIHPIGDSVLLAYCAGSIDDGVCHARLRVRKLAIADILS